jgi:exopolysaccharide biosynthesis polyprenyl glycosylphosphotransferase
VGPYALAPQVMALGNSPFLTFDWVPTRPGALAVKYAFDVIVAAAVLLSLSPMLLAVALAIRLTMGAPVIFSQERVGLHGRRFRLYKFRTMVKDAEAQRAQLLGQNEMSGPVFKLTDDPRVTRLGRFLRKWSLDEFPQFLNVLLGQMSLVGPRPLPVAEQQEIQGWYRRRLSIKPGITGLWQVSGRSDVDFDDWMKLDLRYVEQWSLRLDLELLLRTVPAVLARRGAK